MRSSPTSAWTWQTNSPDRRSPLTEVGGGSVLVVRVDTFVVRVPALGGRTWAPDLTVRPALHCPPHQHNTCPPTCTSCLCTGPSRCPLPLDEGRRRRAPQHRSGSEHRGWDQASMKGGAGKRRDIFRPSPSRSV